MEVLFCLQEISTRQDISLHYLEQLFRKLRNGQAVKSVRGPGGGYVLARHMDEISIKDVLDCVGENINPARDIVAAPVGTPCTVESKLSKGYFENLGVIMQEYLSTTSLGDLARKAQEESLSTVELQAPAAVAEPKVGVGDAASNIASSLRDSFTKEVDR